MRKYFIGFIILLCLGAVLGSIISQDIRRFFTLYANGPSNLIASQDIDDLSASDAGAYYFIGGDFGSLSTDTLRGSATPWVLTASAITLDYVGGDLTKVTTQATRDAFQQWGFLTPQNIANWPDTLPVPTLEAPLGLTIGVVKRRFPPIQITAANISCASCHSSVNYRADGYPELEKVWLGQPNGSINLEAYPQAIFDAFNRYGQDERLMQAAEILFPDITKTEKLTLERIIRPAAVKRIKELNDTIGRAVPFSNGYPGATNGLDSLNIRLGLQDREEVPAYSAFNSIPNLDGHAYRTSFLNAATYEIPGIDVERMLARSDLSETHINALGSIVAFFTVPSMGVDMETAESHMAQAQKAMHFASKLKTQVFPGNIDETLADAGRPLFAQHCASCHGEYDGDDLLKSFPNYVGMIGTDSLRIDLLKAAGTADGVNRSIMGKYIKSTAPIGYSAPALNGVWASAPYMHNGSIPTLVHFFEPKTRPEKFLIGGQRLSFDMVGIDGYLDDDGTWVYPDGYTPWANAVVFDTSRKGHSNKGHEMPFDKLSDADKRALLEYLKKL